jgi:hypothetical protein
MGKAKRKYIRIQVIGITSCFRNDGTTPCERESVAAIPAVEWEITVHTGGWEDFLFHRYYTRKHAALKKIEKLEHQYGVVAEIYQN